MLLNLNQQVFEGLRIGFKKIKIKNLNLNQTEATKLNQPRSEERRVGKECQ